MSWGAGEILSLHSLPSLWAQLVPYWNYEIRPKDSHKNITAFIAPAFWNPTFGACQSVQKIGDKSCSLCTEFPRILLSSYLDSWGDKGNKSQDVFCRFRDNISNVCHFEYKTEDVLVFLSRKLHAARLRVLKVCAVAGVLVYSAGEVLRSSPLSSAHSEPPLTVKRSGKCRCTTHNATLNAVYILANISRGRFVVTCVVTMESAIKSLLYDFFKQ